LVSLRLCGSARGYALGFVFLKVKTVSQKLYLSRGRREVKGFFPVNHNLLLSLRSLRALREDSVFAVCLMLVQNLDDNEKFMGQQWCNIFRKIKIVKSYCNMIVVYAIFKPCYGQVKKFLSR